MAIWYKCAKMKNFPPWKKLLFSICLLLISLLIGYGLTVTGRAWSLYSYAKGLSRGWRSPAYRSDPELGWVPMPGARSAHAFPTGPDIPMQFDADGFRIPVGEQRPNRRSRPLILALGCSLTYGDACAAEDTFPHKVAQALGGTELNAGVCSYGLAQMMLLAERLIPQYSPDYVLIQYSPWLFDRATAHFAPTYFSYASSPFFADTHAGGVEIRPPVFSNYDLDLSPWRVSRRGPLDFMSFLLRGALPLFVHDDLSILSYRARCAAGLIKKPTRNRGAVLKIAYGRMQALCSQNKSLPLIVILGNSSAAVPVPDELRELGMPLVNAHAALISSLSEPTDDAYGRAYGHFRGSPPVCVDGHPNPRAHTLIAESIVDHIRALQPLTRKKQNGAQQTNPSD